MSNHFMLLLRKDDIIDLFKYGQWFAYCPCINFDGNVQTLANNKKLVEKLFKQANAFEYSIEYFLVHVECPKASYIEIDDVLNIIALDNDSYKIGLSFSPEIKLGQPIFEEHYINFQINNEINSLKKGVDNIFAIFDLNIPKPMIKKDELEVIVHDSYWEKSIEGDKGLWYYLLRYERHQSYPKDNRGFFLDSLHAFYNFEKKRDMDVSIIQSNMGTLIMQQDERIKYKELVSVIDSQKDFHKRCETPKKGFYRIAPLYLMLKSTFEQGVHDEYNYCGVDLNRFIDTMKKNYDNDDLIKAVYLLGLSLGRSNTYQYLYKKNKLPILKTN